MQSKRDSEITGHVARKIRQELGLSQAEFWGAIGIRRETGNNYERRGRLTEPVRLLVFAHYIAGIPVNDLQELRRVGAVAKAMREAGARLSEAAESVSQAAIYIESAVEAVTTEEEQHG